LLRGYRFEHPKTEMIVIIGGWSYLWAGLLGFAYVWWTGQGSVVRAAAINIGFAVFSVGVVGVTSFVPPAIQFLAIIGLVPAVVFVQGIAMIAIVRTGFRRRGWLVSPA
jgi:hypothetical protein